MSTSRTSPIGEVRGFERARLATFGAVQTNVTDDRRGLREAGVRAEVEADFEPGTDAAALRDGVACYTPLIGVCEASTDIPSSLASDSVRPSPRWMMSDVFFPYRFDNRYALMWAPFGTWPG